MRSLNRMPVEAQRVIDGAIHAAYENNRVAWRFWPFHYVRVGHVFIFTFLHGLIRYFGAGRVKAVTFCGLKLAKWGA